MCGDDPLCMWALWIRPPLSVYMFMSAMICTCTHVYTQCTFLRVYRYMEIHVYSTLAYIKVGRKERQPRQTIHTKPRTYMYMYIHVH